MSLEEMPCLYADNASLLKEIYVNECVSDDEIRMVLARMLTGSFACPDDTAIQVEISRTAKAQCDIGNAVLQHKLWEYEGVDPEDFFELVLPVLVYKVLPKLRTSHSERGSDKSGILFDFSGTYV